MLPAQDENRQISSDSALGDNLEVFFSSKIVGSVDDLRHQLDGIELGEIAETELQIGRIVAPLGHLENVLGILATLLRCQDKINVAAQENIQALEQVQREVLSRPSHANPLLGLADLITLRNIDSPARETPAVGVSIAVRAATSELRSSSTADQVASGESLTANDELPPSDAAAEYLISPPWVHQAVDLPSDPELPAQQNNSARMAAQESLGRTHAIDDGTTEVREAQAKTREPAAQNSDFDNKLLDDLIKNYGEFAANPNLPATLDTPRQEIRFPEKPRLPRENKIVAARNPKDLDRQLKKLIQDYGEYDLYSAHGGALKTKLRMGGAFVALALALGGIYYFSAPKTIAAPAASFLQQSTTGAAVKARKPEPGSASQTLSTQEKSTRGAAGLDDLPQAFNKDSATKRKITEKGGTKR